jgi:low affinity Fe/Cu permease
MERDLAAIQAKLDSLEQEADAIGTEHPEEAAIIRDRITQIQQIWEQLTQMVSVDIALTNILEPNVMVEWFKSGHGGWLS